MDPGSGKLYTPEQTQRMDAEKRARMVLLEGSEEHIRSIAAHVERGTRKTRRKAARKAQRASRRKNR